MPRLGSTLAATITVGILATSLARAEDRAPTSQPDELVQTLRTPDGGIQPRAAMDERGVLHLIYFKGDPAAGDIFYVHTEPGGREFTKPVRVNSQAGAAVAVGNIRGPQIALGKDARVHVLWNGSGRAQPRGPANPARAADAPGNGTPILYARGNDKGDGFEPQRCLNRFSYDIDGGGTVAADGKGRVFALWHAHDPKGPETEAGRRVYVARSDDDGATWARETPAIAEQTGACPCCGLAGLADDKGVFILFRAATEKVHRDIHLLWSNDGGRSFADAVADRWELMSCPMSSESLVRDGNRVLAAWETRGRVLFARVDPGTGKLGEPTPAPTLGKCKYPALAADSAGRMIFAWTEGMSWARGGTGAWQVYDAEGKPVTDGAGRVKDVPAWSLVAVVARPGGGFVFIY
ncbi:MAG: hypothetical protein BIFFINMI_00990 [Phycisphaerae bacterium]|nr:hypothetical protein [Phycisphaerae bacterium]